ncbi:hypothetical protein [Sulfurovum sp.]|uniref:hypothetical protein n=1 Tax=Sulfurovum sp. TaxID=1969726 RepID=UPI0035644168
MKKLLMLIGIVFMLQAQAESVGSIVFFNITSTEQSDEETNEDFYFYYDKLNDFLTKKGFDVLLAEQLPIKIEKPDYTIELGASDVASDVGIIFVKPSGQYKVSEGVKTDVDVAMEAEQYFKVKLVGE